MPDSTSPSTAAADRVGDVGFLLTLRDHLGIIHHVPGRIRLRFDPDRVLTALGGRIDRLEGTLARVPGITGFEVNAAARSLVVTYEPARFAPSAWALLLTGTRAAAAELLRSVLAPGPATVPAG